MVTSEQIRAARALLRMEQRELAEAAGVSIPTLQRVEGAPGTAVGSYKTISAIKSALEARGIVFLAHGVAIDPGP